MDTSDCRMSISEQVQKGHGWLGFDHTAFEPGQDQNVEHFEWNFSGSSPGF